MDAGAARDRDLADHPPRGVDLTAADEDHDDRCRRSLSEEQDRRLAATDGWAHVDKDRAHADWDALYAEDTAMNEFHDAYHPGMVDLLGPAMRVFAAALPTAG